MVLVGLAVYEDAEVIGRRLLHAIQAAAFELPADVRAATDQR